MAVLILAPIDDKEPMKIIRILQQPVDNIKITALVRFLLALCIMVTTTVVRPNAVLAASATPGWIVTCNYSHSLKDDPIVFPNQPGAAHLHDFIGARSTNAFSTFNSLRAGGTACTLPGDSSSYWVPALYENGVRVLPTGQQANTLVYYRRIGAPSGTIVQPFPFDADSERIPPLRLRRHNVTRALWSSLSPSQTVGMEKTLTVLTIYLTCPTRSGAAALPLIP